MKNLIHLQEDMEKKLARKLYKNEIEFLKWLCERHSEEQQQVNA